MIGGADLTLAALIFSVAVTLAATIWIVVKRASVVRTAWVATLAGLAPLAFLLLAESDLVNRQFGLVFLVLLAVLSFAVLSIATLYAFRRSP